jgi:hypothetical protein
MAVLTDFCSVTKDIVTAGPKINASARKEIRQVIGALGDDLENALDVTIIYLRAGIGIADAKKLADHLDHAPEKLLAYYKEFKVCDGLYGLRDEFKQVFNAKRWSVSITNFWRVPHLVEGLASGERSVLDDLREFVNELIQHSASLQSQNGRKSKVMVGSVHDRLRQIIADLEQRKKKIKQSVRAITDTF